jgi:cell division transport system permease protein
MSSIHVKIALSNIRRSPFQAFAAIFVLTITFFIITLLAILAFASDNVLTHFETRPQVIAFLKDDVGTEGIAGLQLKLENDERIKDVSFITKEEALSIYKEATSDNPLLSELVSPSIFPASLEFTLADLSFAEAIISELRNEDVIDQIGFTANIGGEDALQETVNRLRTITWYTRLGGGIFALVLAVTSFLVLLIIISMRITTRRHEVEILDLIGATRGFVRKPIFLEAIIYTIIGVFFGWVLALIIVLYSTPAIMSYFNEIEVLPHDTVALFSVFGIIFAAELLIGIFLAILGGSVAVSRAHKTK